MAEGEIKAVIFDFGETLFKFGKIHNSHYFIRGARLSYDYLKNLGQPIGNYHAYKWRSLLTLRFRLFISNLTKNDFNALEVLKKVLDKKGVHLTDDQYEEYIWLWYESLSKMGRPEPDIKQTLEKLQGMGLKLGILSNTFVPGHCLQWHLKQYDALHYFQTMLYSYDYPRRKPHELIFKAAAEKIELPTENILYVGDRIVTDVAGAENAGMHAILKKAYTNAGKTPPDHTHVIENLSELPAIIEKINSKFAQSA